MNKPVALFVGLSILLAAMVTVQVSTGPANIPLTSLPATLVNPSSPHGIILWNLRIPRMVYGIVLGAGLAVCGLALQGLFRNPLAEPFTLGISSGAGFGAVLAVALGLQSGIWISVCAFIGAFGVTLLVFILIQKTLFSQTALILCGVMIGYFFQSVLMLLIALSPSERAHGAMMWLMGDLGSAPIKMLWITLALSVIGWFFLFRLARGLDLLTMGEEKAASLGVNIPKQRRSVFVWSSLVTGACVAAVGVVGFVGLIIPHALRRVVGPAHRVLFPLCAVAGAAFILACDLIARWVIAPLELPLGVITGMIGSLVFLWIFIRRPG